MKKQIAISLSHRIVTIINGIFVTALVAKYIGGDLYGNFAYLSSLALIFGTALQFGAQTQLQSELSKYYHKNKKLENLLYHNFSVRIVLAFVIVSATVSYLVAHHYSKYLITLIAILIASKVFEPIRTIKDFRLRSDSYLVPEITIILLFSLIKIYLIKNEVNSNAILLLLFLELCTLRLVDVYLTYTSNNFLLTKTKNKKLKKSYKRIKSAFPYFIISIASIGAMRIDQVMLFNLATSSATADYAIAVKLAEGFLSITTAILLVTSQKILHHKTDSQYVRKQFYAFTIVATFIAILVGVLTPNLILLLYGSEYHGTLLPFWILLTIVPLNVISTFNYMTLIRQRSSQRLMIRTVAIVTLNIAFNIAFIPKFGAAGAAAATVLPDLAIITFFYRYKRN